MCMVLPGGQALHSKHRDVAGQHLTVLLCERAALSESLLSGIASTRLCRPPAAQQMTRHLSGPPAHGQAHLAQQGLLCTLPCPAPLLWVPEESPDRASRARCPLRAWV